MTALEALLVLFEWLKAALLDMFRKSYALLSTDVSTRSETDR